LESCPAKELVVDPEIKAMSDIAEALTGLEPDVIRRVLKWANEKYQVKAVGVQLSGGGSGSPPLDRTFTEFSDLFDAANPSTGLERILVCAYWFQVIQGQSDFDSQSLNTELKNFGHPSANITRDMDSLANRSPKLILQTRKEGQSKQARKKFKLTREGIREVQRLLEGKHMDAVE
jgi:hypothetical protein